ncbi:DUF7489 domain-containing protein [Streptomyces beijiangensis]|uniref:DUF7489 domain-containing protein n=1 Tax=Streptomyces beijiangensis TaxID=163361 RepID=A0A939F4T2_9ACTN|nr:hypothetical protein [Streptomyces beijiangensis]MBO0510390.1 hypothetical protein [Streptomyces beijiangensis]
MFNSKRIKPEDSWRGAIVDKSRNIPDGSNMYHYIKVELTEGQTKKFRVDKALWETLEVGDRLIKQPGNAAPTKQ